jgi:hypothetical protein
MVRETEPVTMVLAQKMELVMDLVMEQVPELAMVLVQKATEAEESN